MNDIRLESTPKHVRAFLNGQVVVDSQNAQILYGAYYFPYYLFPVNDIKAEIVTDQTIDKPHRWLGSMRQANLSVNGQLLENSVGLYEHTEVADVDFSGLVGIRWDSMDAWFEEAEEVFVHPHNPYHRIDVVQSNRNVRVVIDDVCVAESNHPVMLLETGLPVRWYLPKVDIRLDLLQPSETVTGCAYKGFANYYSTNFGDNQYVDAAWYYKAPFREVLPIASHVSFFNERFDFYIDGVHQPKQVNQWTDAKPEGSSNDPIDG